MNTYPTPQNLAVEQANLDNIGIVRLSNTEKADELLEQLEKVRQITERILNNLKEVME